MARFRDRSQWSQAGVGAKTESGKSIHITQVRRRAVATPRTRPSGWPPKRIRPDIVNLSASHLKVAGIRHLGGLARDECASPPGRPGARVRREAPPKDPATMRPAQPGSSPRATSAAECPSRKAAAARDAGPVMAGPMAAVQYDSRGSRGRHPPDRVHWPVPGGAGIPVFTSPAARGRGSGPPRSTHGPARRPRRSPPRRGPRRAGRRSGRRSP